VECTRHGPRDRGLKLEETTRIGLSGTLLLTEARRGCRHVQCATVRSSKRWFGHVGARKLNDIEKPTVASVAMQSASRIQRDPDAILAVDGQSVRVASLRFDLCEDGVLADAAVRGDGT
jgi:hypothetical protein